MAFDCLLLCKAPGRSQVLAQYLFHVIRHDYSLTVRRHVARAFSESILMTLAVGEVYMATPPGIIEVTDNAEQREKDREQEQAKIVKAVRKEFNSKPELRQELLSTLIDAFTGNDREILFALIKAAEVMSSTVPEPKPGAIIKLQTPIAETPAVTTPKIRLSMTPSETRAPAPEADGELRMAPGADKAGYGFPRVPPQEAASPGGAGAIKLVLNNPAAPPKEKKKKKKNVPKAQSGGLSDQDFKAVTVVLAKLQADKRSIFFRHPVDPVRDHAPDYTSIVKHPMDLMSASAKFEGGQYATREEFEADIRLIISNCYLYNPVNSPVRKAGEAFEAMFNRSTSTWSEQQLTSVWAKTENTLKSSNAPSEPGPAASPAKSKQAPAETSLMPPPPLPGGSGGAMKIKLKQPKTVTIDPGPVPMLPPPLPKKASTAGPSSPAKEKEKLPKEKDKEKPPKKKKAPPASVVDDLLGAELDLLEGTAPPAPPPRVRKGSRDEELEDLLVGASSPPTKKIKLNSKPRPSPSSSGSSGPSPSSLSPAFVPRDKGEKQKPGLKVKIGGGESSKIKVLSDSPKLKIGGEGMSKPRSSDGSSKIKIGGESSKSKYAGERERDRDRDRERERERPSSSEPRSLSESYKPRSSDGKPRSRDDPSRPAKPSAEFREALKKPEKEKRPKTDKPRERTMSPGRPAGNPIFSPPPPVDALLSPQVPAQPMVARTTAATSRTPPAPAAPAPAPTPLAYTGLPVQWPRPPNDLPLTTGNSMPFKQKRAKNMVQSLIKDPNAIYVS